MVTQQPSFNEFKWRIGDAVTNIKEVSNQQGFNEWAEILYDIGLCGIDFCDVYDTMQGCEGELVHITARNISELHRQLKMELRFDLKGVVVAMHLPGACGLDTVGAVIELITSFLSPDATVTYQAANYSGEHLRIYIMKCTGSM